MNSVVQRQRAGRDRVPAGSLARSRGARDVRRLRRCFQMREPSGRLRKPPAWTCGVSTKTTAGGTSTETMRNRSRLILETRCDSQIVLQRAELTNFEERKLTLLHHCRWRAERVHEFVHRHRCGTRGIIPVGRKALPSNREITPGPPGAGAVHERKTAQDLCCGMGLS